MPAPPDVEPLPCRLTCANAPVETNAAAAIPISSFFIQDSPVLVEAQAIQTQETAAM
jgi:hypothetical protein